MRTFTSFILLILFCSCSRSFVIDRNGSKYPVKKFKDGRVWMIKNLNLDVPGSFCYSDSAEKCVKYGRMYTWAEAQKVCSYLGDGWKLPTAEEWRQMAFHYGKSSGDSFLTVKSSFASLLEGGEAGFNAVLGGGRNLVGEYTRGDAHGFYWTATETDSTLAWFANFAKGSQSLYLQKDGEKPRAFSVRCIKRN